METTSAQRAATLVALREEVGDEPISVALLRRSIRDVDTLVEMLRRAALGQETHIRSFHDPLCGECLGCQARAILGES